jgi:hypothetical protein
MVLESEARIGEARAAGGDPLFPNSVMTTDVRGRATFSVREALEDCQIQPETRLTVEPSPRTPLEVDQGSIVCRSNQGGQVKQIKAGEATVNFMDPIFLVGVGGSATEVRVNFGFVELRKDDRRSPGRLLGPGGQMTIGPGSLPERAQRFEAAGLDRFDAEALTRMRAALPSEPRGFPAISGSNTLQNIRSAGRLRVGLESSASRAVGRFSNGLFQAVSSNWEVRLDSSRRGRDEASQALRDGGLDAYVSLGPVPGAARIPLFDDEREQDWYLSVRPETRFQDALEGRLRTILDNGEYGEAYFAAFGQVPTYEGVRPLVYPSPGQPDLWKLAQAPKVRRVTLEAGPVNYSGQCPTEIEFNGTIVADGPGVVEYEFLASDGSTTRGTLEFERQGTLEVEETREVAKSTKGSMVLRVRDQGIESDKVEYTVTCQVPSPSPPKSSPTPFEVTVATR